MNKHLQKLALAALLVPVSVNATEMRTPWIAGDGPLRYTFEKLHKDKGNINVWSAMHIKEASRAFLKHGTKTQDISALIFNKQDFILNEIFPDSSVPFNAENFNPFMAIKALHPRVEYMEYGVTVGMRWDHPVCDKGRVGIRASVPFRRIEMERQDPGLDENEDPLAEFVSRKVIRINADASGQRGSGTLPPALTPLVTGAMTDVLVSAYRMDLIGHIPNAVGDPILVGAPNSVTLFTNGQFAYDGAGGAGAGGTVLTTNNGTPAALTTTVANGTKPVVNAYMLTNAIATNTALSDFAIADVRSLDAAYTANLPTQNTLAYFNATAGAGSDYSNTFPTLVNPLGNAGFQANADKTWLVFRRATNSVNDDRFVDNNAAQAVAANTGPGEAAVRTLEIYLKQFNQNVFDFLNTNNFDFDSRIREGMGDIDLDVFYEHTFSNEWMGELSLGVRFPTGGDKDQYGNPYKPMLGNGEHWEVKIGAMAVYQPLSWMNMKLDAKYSFVLEDEEHRMAAFKGATIKNMGPRADCDVDWGYFVGRFDFNFFHPKDSGIRSTVGYELYYKTEDNLTFKQATMESWLGGLIVGGVVHENKKALDNKLASKNTQSIAHKIRFETSAQLLKHFEIFAGGSLTVAGQQVMRDRDAHGGFNIRF